MVKYWLHLDDNNSDVRELSRDAARALLSGSTPWPAYEGWPPHFRGERYRRTVLGLKMEVRYVRR